MKGVESQRNKFPINLPKPVYQIKMLATKIIYPATFLGQVLFEKCHTIRKILAKASKNIYIECIHPLSFVEIIIKIKMKNHKQ